MKTRRKDKKGLYNNSLHIHDIAHVRQLRTREMETAQQRKTKTPNNEKIRS